MNCENQFCIYWEDKNCVLETVSLDHQGSCESCIWVNLDESLLERERKKLRLRLEQEDER